MSYAGGVTTNRTCLAQFVVDRGGPFIMEEIDDIGAGQLFSCIEGPLTTASNNRHTSF